MTRVPFCAAELTADWFSDVLGQPVTEADVTPIGRDEAFTGGSLFRVLVQFRGSPGRYVAKLSPFDPEMRAVMAVVNANEVEFYRRFASTHSLPTPRCGLASADTESGATVLLIEDLGQTTQLPFVAGCGEQRAAEVVSSLAQLHLTSRQLQGFSTLGFGDISRGFDFAHLWKGYGAKVQTILPGAVLSDRLLAIGNAISKDPDQVMAGLFGRGPRCALHRDLHLDNILFSPKAGEGAVAKFVDWQFWGPGPGGLDLGYFLCSSLEPAVRRGSEGRLIDQYVTALDAGGLRGYGKEAILRDVKLSAVWKLYLTVVASLVFDNSTAHKRQWRAQDLRRLSAFLDDYDVTLRDLS